MAAGNFSLQKTTLKGLCSDLEAPSFLALGEDWQRYARLWIGPRGTLTRLHHDLVPSIFVQVSGAKRFIMVNPLFTPLIPNPRSVYSDCDPMTWHSDEALSKLPRYEFELSAGDMLYIPPAWWHWVYSCSASISVTYTGFTFGGVSGEWREPYVSAEHRVARPSSVGATRD